LSNYLNRDTLGNMKKVVVIGGGTGSSVVLSALKNIPNMELTALPVVTDSGGSTGRLRDEFGFLPVGDLRQCLMALADDQTQQDIKELLLYRFDKGSGLQGHNLGNLILTALEDIEGKPGKAIEVASKIFRIKGKVLPITENSTDLVITYEDGKKLIGEHFLDDHEKGGKKITKLELNKPAKLYKKAEKAILEADTIVVGPGDVFGSLLPHTLVRGFKETFKKSTAKFVYITNLMTHFSQTHDMSATDHVNIIEKYFGKYPDLVIVNSEKIPKKILQAYEEEKEFPVVDDLPREKYIKRAELVSKVIAEQNQNDKINRSLLRHDSKQLTEILKKV
jgi:uncharacterized cofD-like protein